MLITYKSREEIEALKQLLSFEFDIKNLDHAKNILGMETKRDRIKRTMSLSHKKVLRKGIWNLWYDML